MINLKCPKCDKQLNVKDELAGKKGKCPQCGGMIIVPQSASSPSLETISPPKTYNFKEKSVGLGKKKTWLIAILALSILGIGGIALFIFVRTKPPSPERTEIQSTPDDSKKTEHERVEEISADETKDYVSEKSEKLPDDKTKDVVNDKPENASDNEIEDAEPGRIEKTQNEVAEETPSDDEEDLQNQSYEISTEADGPVISRGSSLIRESILFNAPSSPVQIISHSIGEKYEDRRFVWEAETTINVDETIQAIQLRLMQYDVFGQHMQNLGNTEIRDLDSGKATFEGKWRARETDVAHFLTSVTYVARVRFEDGTQWVYDEGKLVEALQKLDLEQKIEEEYPDME